MAVATAPAFGQDAPASSASAEAPAAVAPADVAATEAALAFDPATRRIVQIQLNRLGHCVGAEDGIFGPQTRKGLRAWQATTGRAQTGYLDTPQRHALLLADPEQGVAECVATGKSKKNGTFFCPAVLCGPAMDIRGF